LADNDKLQEHMAALGDNTSGGSHDAVTFAGRGLQVLRDLFKRAKKDNYEGSEEDEEEDEEGMEEEPVKKKKMKKKAGGKKYEANGGPLEDEDEEGLDDPGQEGEEDIIANHGEHKKGKGAVKKSEGTFDERRFQKNLDGFEDRNEDVLDASDALAELTKHVRTLAKSAGAMDTGMSEVQGTVFAIAKSQQALLKSVTGLAADLEQIKKQPGTAPAPGFVVMTKNAAGKPRILAKSEIADVVAEAANQGLVDGMSLRKLHSASTPEELNAFVTALPADVQAML
jgi:hypothetical protein